MPITGPDFKLPPSACAFCGEVQDESAEYGGARRGPKPGDIAICIDCGAVNILDSDLCHRRPTAEEEAEICARPDVREAQSIARRSRGSWSRFQRITSAGEN